MILFILAHFGHHLLIASVVPLLPFIRTDLALDYTQAGWLVSACTLAYGASQLPSGWLTDRIGPRIMVTLGLSGVALSGLLVGLSPVYVVIAISLMLMGILGGGYHPSAVPLIAASVEPENRGRALGIHQIGGTASFFLAPLIAVGIAGTLGWRGSFIGVAIPVFILGITFYILLKRRGYDKRTEPKISKGNITTTPVSINKTQLIAILILGIFGQALVEATISYIPLYVVDKFGVSEGSAGAVLSFVHVAGFWAGPLGGYLSDRWGSVNVMILASLLGGPILYLINLAPYGYGMFAILLVIGTTLYLRMPVAESYLISHTSERNRSTILGIYYSGSRGGSGVIMPLVGNIIDRFGFFTGFSVIAATQVIISLICSILLWKKRN